MLYLLLGVCVAGVPLTGLLLYQMHHSRALRQQVSYYKKQEEDSQYLTVWTLKQQLKAGEVLTREALQEAHVQLHDAEELAGIADVEQLVGQIAKTGLEKGTIIQPKLFYEGEVCPDDLRVKEVTNVQLPVQLQENDYVDLRIGFPDGEDYIVVRHKSVLGLLRNEESQQLEGVRLELSEEELLRLSAASIDADVYENTNLYAIQYREDFQEAAQHDYPINRKVYTLLQWDPNVTRRMSFQGEKKKRLLLESNLRQYEKRSDSIARDVQTNDAQSSEGATQENEMELELFE